MPTSITKLYGRRCVPCTRPLMRVPSSAISVTKARRRR